MKLEELKITSINNQFEIAEKMTIDESIYEQFRIYTKLYGASEWGGVCIGYQEDKTFHVRGIILPPQKIQSGGYCEFRKEIFPLVTKQIIRLTADKKELFNYRSGVWIHTHPGLGVFFSGTDFNSFKYLTALSPDFLAVVVDPISNEVIGYNGKIKTTIEEVPEETVDEETDAKEPDDAETDASAKATEPVEIQEFTEIDIQIVKPDLSNDIELEFLAEFRQAIQSKAAAEEIGDTERIHVFIPIEENELKLNTMSMKVDFLENQLSKMETRPTYSRDLHFETLQQLYGIAHRYRLDPDLVIPQTLVIKPEGILYIWHETKYRQSAKLVEWNDIEDVEGIILEEHATKQLGYPSVLQVIQLKIKHKKPGLFSKRPEDLKLLTLSVDSRDLFRCLVEYQPDTSFFKLPPKKEPVESEEEYEESEDAETDTPDEDSTSDEDEDLEDDDDEDSTSDDEDDEEEEEDDERSRVRVGNSKME